MHAWACCRAWGCRVEQVKGWGLSTERAPCFRRRDATALSGMACRGPATAVLTGPAAVVESK